MRPMEIAGWVVYTFIVTISNFSGMAGGFPLIVIIGMFNFTMKAGIPLSNAQIFAASIVRLALDGRNPHPLRKKGTVVDYPIVSMMFPMITVGSAISSFSSPAIPDVYITIGFAVIVLGVMIFSIFRLNA
jgi:uncharacterized membrane protein YfcA